MYHVPLDLHRIYGRSDEGGENDNGKGVVTLLEEGREWIVPDPLVCG